MQYSLFPAVNINQVTQWSHPHPTPSATLEGGSRMGGDEVTGCVQPPVQVVASSLLALNTQVWTVGGHLLLGLEHPHCWLENNRHSLPNNIFLVQRKILSLLGIKIHSYETVCRFLKKLPGSHSEFCSSHLTVFNASIQCLQSFQLQSLGWGFRSMQHECVLRKRKCSCQLTA